MRLRSGWFSDRSATYLAAGRPVITQDTGFGNVLPTGEGLFAFSTMDDVVAAVDEINGDYERHRARGAGHRPRVLRPRRRCSAAAGRSRRAAPRPSGRGERPATVDEAFAPELDLSVVRRRPTTLQPQTVSSGARCRPLPELAGELPTTPPRSASSSSPTTTSCSPGCAWRACSATPAVRRRDHRRRQRARRT